MFIQLRMKYQEATVNVSLDMPCNLCIVIILFALTGTAAYATTTCATAAPTTAAPVTTASTTEATTMVAAAAAVSPVQGTDIAIATTA